MWFYVMILEIVQYESGNLEAWSFGQILAMSIWFPVITKYIYWLICKENPSPKHLVF
jgi:hypothetical protein